MNITNFIFNHLSFIYKKPKNICVNNFNDEELTNLLIKNNLFADYAFKNKKVLNKLDSNYISKLKIKINLLKNSIKICNDLMEDFLIFKTYRGNNFTRIPNDLDIIVPHKKYNFYKQKFLKKKFLIKDEIIEEGSYGLHKKNFLKIHIHSQISWCEKKFISNNFLFSSTQNVEFHQMNIKIPNKEAEFLIILAHSNFEPLHLMISEIVYLYSMIEDIELDKVLLEAKKYNWNITLEKVLGALNDLHYYIYGKKIKKLNKFKTKFEDVFINKNSPYVYKRLHLIKSVNETKIHKYVLKKIFKVIWHSIKMNTFNFINSPEK